MDTTIKTEPTVLEEKRDTSGIAGHPRGLMVLFFTEFWERFSFYGMRALLIIYMTHAISDGGLGLSDARAASIYGTYMMSVWFTALPGGWIADQFLGHRLAVAVGGVIIAMGHFSMAFPSVTTFYAGLVLITVGTGFLKPNISTMVGALYGENDPRRDSGFSIFYMGINFGAWISPFVCGFLAQTESFRNFLSSLGLNPLGSWHWGFAAAGVGMILGLISYAAFGGRLAHVGMRPKTRPRAQEKDRDQRTASGEARRPLWMTVVGGLVGALVGGVVGILIADVIGGSIGGLVGALIGGLLPSRLPALSRADWMRIAAIFVFFLFSIIFWSVYEQAGSSFNLFADRFTRNEIFGRGFPASYLQSLQAIFVILLSPVFAWLWIKLGRLEPSSPAKFAYGLFFVALSVLLMVPASRLAASGKVSLLWLVGVYFLSVVGELCLSPVGLSTVTKLAPASLVGMMMGVWFVSIAIGEKIAGYLAGHLSGNDTSVLVPLFGYTGIVVLVAVAILAIIAPRVRKLMGGVH
jgi:POT family proton-dependent oligopeptide transporter